jgi:hypothetical protein
MWYKLMMHFDFSGAELFLAYRDGRATAKQVLAHPAYQRVSLHARLFSDGISPADIRPADLDAALHGEPSPFYGLDDLPGRLTQIERLLDTLRREGDAWLAIAETELRTLFPREDLDIPIYPVLGYDMGIGLDGAVCMNANHVPYLAEPIEFLFYILHECTHVIYERRHPIPPLQAVTTPAAWQSYFNLWLQNEGYAVYAPLRLRQERGCLADRDYQVLMDPQQVEAHRLALLAALETLQGATPLTREQYLEICFGPQRLTYRMGCELIRRIEKAYGLEAVRQGFYEQGDGFIHHVF